MGLTSAEFDRLTTEHGPAMFRLAFRLVGSREEAEDVVQEAFRSVWQSRHSYDPTRSPRAWLATILRRRVADWYRRPSLDWNLVDDPTEAFSARDEETLADEPFCDEVQHALDHLPADWKEALLLVVVGELTHQEAAEVLGVPVGTVLSRVSRARARMREYLNPRPTNSDEDAAATLPLKEGVRPGRKRS